MLKMYLADRKLEVMLWSFKVMFWSFVIKTGWGGEEVLVRYAEVLVPKFTV